MSSENMVTDPFTIGLPEKPSELIRIAINDLEACEKDEQYKINMEEWHTPYLKIDNEINCSVCLAGAVMAKSLEASISTVLSPGNFNTYTNKRLVALDMFRCGQWKWGLQHMFSRMQVFPLEMETALIETINLWGYDSSPKQFKSEMRKAADIMEKWGW